MARASAPCLSVATSASARHCSPVQASGKFALLTTKSAYVSSSSRPAFRASVWEIRCLGGWGSRLEWVAAVAAGPPPSQQTKQQTKQQHPCGPTQTSLTQARQHPPAPSLTHPGAAAPPPPAQARRAAAPKPQAPALPLSGGRQSRQGRRLLRLRPPDQESAPLEAWARQGCGCKCECRLRCWWTGRGRRGASGG